MAAKHILACIDFSEQSTRALAEVGRYAKANGSEVTLIHIFDPQAFIPPQAVLEPASAVDESARKAKLQTLGEQYLADIDFELAVLEDHAPAKAICGYAEQHGVALD